MLNLLKSNLENIIYVQWEESERGWGTRPDGCSLHLSEVDYKLYLKKYWDSLPKEVPDEYSRPVGKPVIAFVDVELYQQIKKSDNGIRFWNSEERDAINEKKLIY